MTYDPNTTPPREPREPVYTETVIVRPESNAGWWVAGGLGAVVLIAVLWILASGGRENDSDALLAEAQADAIAAQAQADQAVLQNQINGARQSVDIARMDAARAQAEAMRATSEARAETARAAAQPPVVITVPAAPAAVPESSAGATITSTSPQP
ncbi:MAG: hypothetical protein K2X25_16295 [Caulobacteraceae bacterium]|nr:hypothetical protein [Caulobacteraceae bacterium]